MNKTIVIYHKSDFDGIFCREIARKFLPEAELIGWEYGEPTPAVPPEATLYIMDLSVPDLMGHPNLIWIDHHKTAIDLYDNPDNQTSTSDFADHSCRRIPGYRIDGVAACRLAWQWFTNGVADKVTTSAAWLPEKQHFINCGVEEPFAVTLAGEYDVWDQRYADAELFQHGLKSQPLAKREWNALLEDDDELVDRLLGQAIMVKYAKAQENETIIRNNGFTVQWEGLTLLCCNAGSYNSHLFTAGIQPEHDGLLGFCLRADGKWSVSLYGVPGKPDVDLSVIATKYGGGGHKQACGFKCDRLPFLPPPVEVADLWRCISHACGVPHGHFKTAQEFIEFVQKMRGRLDVLEGGAA